MFILGIDPGLTGALVLLNAEGELVDFMIMPTVSMHSKKIIDAHCIGDWINSNSYINVSGCAAVLESVHAMPGQGVSSSFNFGRSFGTIEGVLGALKVPYGYVSPQKWKKLAGVIGKDKDEPRSMLLRKYPHWKELQAKAKGQALADAYYIASSWNKIK